jgi:antitoxin component of MazEF toxin-antitoxin module
MIKRLTKVGNSSAVVLDRTIMEMVGFDEGGQVQIEVHGDVVTLRPVHVGMGRERVGMLIRELRPTYGPMMKRLAK